MVKASGQIKQELVSLQDKTEEMADALEPLYEGYLKALSEASKRQLVQAAFHLCTQAYPDKFLALSWDQRNEVQQGLQAIASKIYEQLIEQRAQAKKKSRQPQNRSGLMFLQRLIEARSAGATGASVISATETVEREASGRDNDELLAEERYDSIFDDEPQVSDESNSERSDFESFEPGTTEERASFAEDEFSDLEGALESAMGFDDDDDSEDSDDDIAFEMEVPAADERLTIEEEEDLLAALEGLARRSIELNGRGMNGQDSLSDSSTRMQIEDGELKGGELDGTIPSPDSDSEEATEETPLSPIHLVKQQMLLEKAIRDVFKSVSDEVNDLLQKANVMPNFPKALMAAASDSRGMGDPINAVPNVVRVSVRVMHSEVMMEGDADEEDSPRRESGKRLSARRQNRGQGSSGGSRRRTEKSGRQAGRTSGRGEERNARRKSSRDMDRSEMQSGSGRRMMRSLPHDAIEIEALPELAAVSLQLSEVEFADPTVSAWRGRLRQKLGDLKKLGMRYKKTQRSLETAQAEDAWRSSWTVDSD